MTKVLAINGSAREAGNTDILIDRLLDGASGEGAQAEKILLNKLDISPCSERECEEVSPDGSSIVDDDFNMLFHKIDSADVVVIGSPVYFGSVSAQTKIMIDRFQCVWIARNFKKMEDVFSTQKKGAFLCVSAAEREDFFENAKSIVRNLFATLNIECGEELFFRSLEAKGDVKHHEDLLRKAYEAGKRLAGG